MATIGHIAVGLAAGRRFSNVLGRPVRMWRTMAVLALLSLLPDLDAIGFHFGVRYASALGHRGASHSLAFAMLVGGIAWLVSVALRLSPGRTALLVTAVVASHGLLDALTDGGLGCALFYPLSQERCFAPVRPLPVAPIGRHLLSARGLHVLLVETIYFAPLLLYGLWPRRSRAMAGVTLEEARRPAPEASR